MNSGNAFSNYVNAELKVDETFITENCIAKKRKNANTADLSRIYCELLACKKGNSSKSGTSPLDLCTNSAEISNNSNLQINQNDVNVFSLHEEELLSILQDLQQNPSSETNNSLVNGYNKWIKQFHWNLYQQVFLYIDMVIYLGMHNSCILQS